MMQFANVPGMAKRKPADLTILPFWQNKKRPLPACEFKELSSLANLPVKAGDFQGKEGECLLLYSPKRKEKRVLLLGLGDKNKGTGETLRRAYAAAVKACHKKKVKHINVGLPKGVGKEGSSAIAEGLLLANYTFDQLKKDSLKGDPQVTVSKACFIGASKEEMAACHRSQKLIGAVNFARDLVNGNADDVTPQYLSKMAEGLEKEFSSIKTTVLGKKEIEKENLGLLLAVSRASAVDPAFIIVEYRGDPGSKERTALLGKGITYDTGGLQLKTVPAHMEEMKSDMSAAATVLGTLRAAADLGLKVNIVGVIPATENAIGPKSFKPGDVYVSHAGKTVEVADPDAEGRLVLADAVSYAQKHLSPTRIIDLATLTGGIIIALGEETTGLFSNNDGLAKKLIAAGEKTYERLWRMPLFEEYRERLNSTIADIRNTGPRKATSINGALFIKEFVHKEMPWAHLDIAGTAYLSNPKYYHNTPATGVGIRLLIEFFNES